MDIQLKGPWTQAQIDEYLKDTVYPLRVGCIACDGFPRVVSVWYHYADGQFHCASHRSSQLVALLRDNGNVGFEVAPNEPPYCGVRGQGVATLSDVGGGDILEKLLDRYLGGSESNLGNWLLSRREDEVLISITPQRLFSWDYRQRMDGAG